MNETLMESTAPLPRSAWTAIGYSPNGERLASVVGVDATEILIQDISGGRPIAKLRQQAGRIGAVSFSPDGTLLASASQDRTIVLWDLATHTAIAELREHELAVVDIEFVPDGSRLISCGRDGRICVWNISKLTTREWPLSRTGFHRKQLGQQVTKSADGKTLATTRSLDWSPGITILSSADLKEVRTIAEAAGIVRAVLFSPTQNLLALCCECGALRFIDLDNDEHLETIDSRTGVQIHPLDFQNNGEHLLTVVRPFDQHEPATQFAVYSTASQKVIAKWESSSEHLCGAISPDGRQVVTGHRDGLRFWSLDDLSDPSHVIVGGLNSETPGLMRSVDYSPDGRYVVAGANLTGRVEIIDANTLEVIGHLSGHRQSINAVRFSPCGSRVASGGSTGRDSIKIWDFETRRELMSIAAPGGSTSSIRWLPDRQSIVALNGRSVINVFRVPSFAEIERRTAESGRTPRPPQGTR